MKKKAFKTAIVIVEVIALAIATLAAALVYFYWRTGQEPVPLGIFTASAEQEVQRRLPEGYDAHIGAIEISRDRKSGEFLLRLEDLKILDADEKPSAEAPEAILKFHLRDLSNGAIGPRSVKMDGARFNIIRRRNLKVDIPVVRSRPRKPGASVLSRLLEGSYLKSAFESAEISNGQITFYDEASKRSWSTSTAEVELRRTEEGLSALAVGLMEIENTTASMRLNASYHQEKDVVDVGFVGSDFPVGDILSTFYGERAAILDAPVSGNGVIAFTPEGIVLSSHFNAEVGQGDLTLGGQRRSIAGISLETSFDPDSNSFDIDRFVFDMEGVAGALKGGVIISFGDDIRKPEQIAFDIQSEEIRIDAPHVFPAMLAFSENKLSGRYRLNERRLSVENLETSFQELKATGFITLTLPRALDGEDKAPSPGVSADFTFDGALNHERLLNIWPKENVANGARDWVEDRLKSAHIDNLKFKMDLAPGLVGDDGAIPDDAMELTFNARDVMAHYVPQMTPLRSGVGSGILKGNSFKLDVEKARVGDVSIVKGEVVFPEFLPKWRPTYYRFTALGNAESMLSILDEKPLTLLSKISLSPDQFDGKARAVVEIMRPNKRDVPTRDYGYTGVATFESMDIDELAGELSLTDAKGRVDLKTRSLTVAANALLADDAPVEFKWTQRFYREDGPSDMEISGVYDAATGDLFGASTRQFVRGPVHFSARALGELGSFSALDVNADFSKAVMSLDFLGWRKPAGAPANGNLKIRFDGGQVIIDAFRLGSENYAHIDGSLSLDASGALQAASITNFTLADSADLMLRAERDASGVLVFNAIGPYLNMAPMLETVLEGGASASSSDEKGEGNAAGPWGAGIALNARIDEISLRNGVTYHDGALDLRRSEQQLQALDFTAFDDGGAPLKVAMSLTGEQDGPQHAIAAQTSAIGELLNGVFGIDSIEGGEGVLHVSPMIEKGGFSGSLEARGMQVVNAPLLARILSAGSLDGLANLLSGEGIQFDYATGEFEYADGVLDVDELHASGSSVGITADGELSFGPRGRAHLTGAVAPMYLLNSVLGNAPLIGDILVGKKGEGIVAFSYAVGGETANPSVVVNPLSALTPGIFRQIMQPQPPTVEEDPQTPESANKEAPSDPDQE